MEGERKGKSHRAVLSPVPIAMAVVGRVSGPGLKTSPCEGGGWGREEQGRRGSVLTRSDKFRVGDANRGDPARGERGCGGEAGSTFLLSSTLRNQMDAAY